MISTTLPILIEELDIEAKKVNRRRSEFDINIDTSIYAEERWEMNFPEQAKRETLTAYMERINAIFNDKNKDSAKASVVSGLKAIYCFIESDRLPTYKAFCQLFNFSDKAYLDELINKMIDIFSIVRDQRLVDPKN